MPYLLDYIKPIKIHKISYYNNELLLVNTEYMDILKRNRLLSFEDIWFINYGELLEKKGERSIVRLELRKNDKERVCLYIKKHVQKISAYNKFFPRSFIAEGPKEFNNYCAFRVNGLATPIPIAAGVKYLSKSHIYSFFISKDFYPLVSVENIILNTPSALAGNCNKDKRRRILTAIATYAKKMHNSGFNQKDFNATHILIDDLDSQQPFVALFDLQRVDRGYLNRYRWPIKALAELIFTLPCNIFSREDKLFLFKAYKNIDKLSLWDKFQYKWILRKVSKIAKHDKKNNLKFKDKLEC